MNTTVFVLGFPRPGMRVIQKGPDGCCTHGGFALQLRNTELEESVVFTASSKQTCSLFQRQPLHHLSRLLSVNMTLRNGPSKSSQGSALSTDFARHGGARETYGGLSVLTLNINIFRHLTYNEVERQPSSTGFKLKTLFP